MGAGFTRSFAGFFLPALSCLARVLKLAHRPSAGSASGESHLQHTCSFPPRPLPPPRCLCVFYVTLLGVPWDLIVSNLSLSSFNTYTMPCTYKIKCTVNFVERLFHLLKLFTRVGRIVKWLTYFSPILILRSHSQTLVHGQFNSPPWRWGQRISRNCSTPGHVHPVPEIKKAGQCLRYFCFFHFSVQSS